MPITRADFNENKFIYGSKKTDAVLSFLRDNSGNAYTSREIADATNILLPTVTQILRKFVKKGINVESKRPYYAYKAEAVKSVPQKKKAVADEESK